MNTAFLCLGGNIGNRTTYINTSKKLLKQSSITIIGESSIYETEAWGSLSEKKYLNQVIKINTNLSVDKLLKIILETEKKLGRERNSDRNSDRTIDIDILFYNDKIISKKNIEVPHPRLHLRKFVLKPLFEIEPNWMHPSLNLSITKLYENCKDKLKVTKFKEKNEPIYICIEGNIGSGKTTLAKALSNELNAIFLPEEFEDNPLLPLFYEDRKLFAFPLEYSFLINRFKQLQVALNSKNKLIISDYSLYKCLWFSKINLNNKDYLRFRKEFNVIASRIKKPDFIIHLNTSNENLQKNIRKRGRIYEKTITENYLEAISRQYKEGFNELKKIKKLSIDITKYHNKLEEESIKKIKQFIDRDIGL